VTFVIVYLDTLVAQSHQISQVEVCDVSLPCKGDLAKCRVLNGEVIHKLELKVIHLLNDIPARRSLVANLRRFGSSFLNFRKLLLRRVNFLLFLDLLWHLRRLLLFFKEDDHQIAVCGDACFFQRKVLFHYLVLVEHFEGIVLHNEVRMLF